MKKLIVACFLLTVSLITYSQSGVGYLNYTVYNMATYQFGAGSYANSGGDFDNMFNITNGATIYGSGVTTVQNAIYYQNTFAPGSPGSYNAIKSYGYFIPKETGTYSFGVDGDDGVDIVIDGNVVTSFYGPHGYGGYRYGTINLVAGNSYSFQVRMQNVGGGWGVYAVWKRPSQSTWSVQSNEVSSTPPPQPTKKAKANFNFNASIDATKFSIGSSTLSSTGLIDITTSLDSTKVNTGYKAITTGGQVEWCVIYEYDVTNNRYRVGIDNRQMTVNPSSVTKLKLFDLWDGPVTYNSSDIYWNEYYIYTNTQFNFSNSTFSSHIRNGSGYHALTADFSYTPITAYNPQSITTTTTNNLTNLYNNIVTVSDVYMAFKELANGGIFGNQNGNEFIYGIQYKNADVNDDGYFNETDCFLLLQNLTGAKTLVDTFNLNKTMRIVAQSKYDSIGKSNWTTFSTPLGSTYTFDINTGKSTDTIKLTVAWKGDVNISHSTTPASNNITTNSVRSTDLVSNEVQGSIITEMIKDKVYAYISFNPLQQEVVGTQFQLKYDNSVLRFEKVEFTTKGSPTNYATNKGDYINVGSLISDGSTILDKTTEYKIIFTPISSITNALGLISIGSTDAVNKGGKQLKMTIN